MFPATMAATVTMRLGIMMVAVYIRVISEFIFQKSFYSCIRITRYPTIEFDASRCQCILSSTSDTTTDKGIDLIFL